jgi:hypothetical protein
MSPDIILRLWSSIWLSTNIHSSISSTAFHIIQRNRLSQRSWSRATYIREHSTLNLLPMYKATQMTILKEWQFPLATVLWSTTHGTHGWNSSTLDLTSRLSFPLQCYHIKRLIIFQWCLASNAYLNIPIGTGVRAITSVIKHSDK